jgi:hypothetical protein
LEDTVFYSTSTNYTNTIDAGKKIEVPVPSSLSVYAQFKYVRGIPASNGQEPVSISRAKVIDNMVSFLNSNISDQPLNKDEVYTPQELEAEIHTLVSSNSPGNYEIGTIFNITA